MEDILKTYIEGQLQELGEDVVVDVDDDLAMIGFDSISYVRLLAFINERFGVRVPDSDVTVERFGTIASMARYLESVGATLAPAEDMG